MAADIQHYKTLGQLMAWTTQPDFCTSGNTFIRSVYLSVQIKFHRWGSQTHSDPENRAWVNTLRSSHLLRNHKKNVFCNFIAESRPLIVQISWQICPPAADRFHDFIRQRRDTESKSIIYLTQHSCNFLEGKTSGKPEWRVDKKNLVTATPTGGGRAVNSYPRISKCFQGSSAWPLRSALHEV